MKHLNDYITEKLRINSKIKLADTIVPQSRDELRNIIKNKIDLDKNANLNNIDVSLVNDMRSLFKGLDPHKIDISEWDVSNVTHMQSMFYDCKNLECDLSKWDVSKVKTMSYMFSGCCKFNCNLSNWNISNCEYIDYMFYNCRNFNSKDLYKWNINKIRSMTEIFTHCDSLKNIPDWYI